jgi:hypothetical protein
LGIREVDEHLRPREEPKQPATGAASLPADPLQVMLHRVRAAIDLLRDLLRREAHEPERGDPGLARRELLGALRPQVDERKKTPRALALPEHLEPRLLTARAGPAAGRFLELRGDGAREFECDLLDLGELGKPGASGGPGCQLDRRLGSTACSRARAGSVSG